MRITNLLVLVVSFCILAQQPQAASVIVSAKKQNTGVYLNNSRELNESPNFTVSTDERMCVVEQSKDWYKVWVNGKSGWVLKSEVVVLKKSKTFDFDSTEVMGYLDNPTPIYILDAEQKDNTPIKLDRSFRDNTTENTDRETVQRQAGGN